MPTLPEIADLRPASLSSPGSVKTFETALRQCLAWDEARSSPEIDRSWLAAWKRHLVESGRAPNTCRSYLSLIRGLLLEAYDQGLLAVDVIVATKRVKTVPVRGQRRGRWLSGAEAARLLAAPNAGTLRGKRDRAMLAVMLGAGLRRNEVVQLNMEHLREIAGRGVIVDLQGKHGRVRSVPVAGWAWKTVMEWIRAARIHDGPVFMRVHASGRPIPKPISRWTVYDIVREHGEAAGLDVAPHDLRRSFAKLAHQGGAALDQISMSLGHASLRTTQIYLGLGQDLRRAPADFIELPDPDTTNED
jgi:integrase